MKYTIIEDCSPYYIRFSHNGIDKFIKYSLDIFNQQDWSETNSIKHPGFSHCKLSPNLGKEFLDRIPIASQVELTPNRVSFFRSAPGLDYCAHKDGTNHRFSINYTVKVLDDKCITSWYSDDDCKQYGIDTLNGSSRECINFDKNKHVPLKTMVAKPNECILFNTDIWHSWDNTQSLNDRIILTFRALNPENVYFEDVRKVLLGV
jgi:hypothetical protein